MSSSVIANRISKTFDPEMLQTALTIIAQLLAGIGAECISLGSTDRRTLTHLNDSNETFLFKVEAYMGSNPEFIPTYLEKDEFAKDVRVVMDLRPLRRSLRQLLEMMDDTSDLAGSEALMAALLYYAAVKAAAKAGVPSAVTIYEDLRTQFAAQSRPRKPVAQAGEPAAAKD